MRSPSYQVQFNSYPNHPKQEQVVVLNKASKQGLSFQRMVSGSFDRTFCAPSAAKDEPVLEMEKAEKSGVNASLHLEFMGVVTESGTLYRHWRAMPSTSFRKWLVGDGAKDSSEYYEFWDDANTLEPFRILEATGTLVVFQKTEEGVTDADVEAALGPANDNDAVAIAQGKSASYPLTCGKDELDGFHPVHGLVPHMVSVTVDLGSTDLDFYVQQLAEDVEAAIGVTEEADLAAQITDSAADRVDDGNSNASTTPEEDAAKLADSWAAMKTTRAGDSEHDFATYALRSLELFAMPDACADVCKKPLAAAQAAVDQNGDGALCNSSPVDKLLACLAELQSPLLQQCNQSPFLSNVMGQCPPAAASRMLDGSSEAEVGVLADGTHAVELGSLSPLARQQLGAGLHHAGQDVGDLSGARLLVNSTGGRDVVVGGGAVQSSTRRLSLITWCGNHVWPFCFQIAFPPRCAKTWDDTSGCKFFLKFMIKQPAGTGAFALKIRLYGEFDVLDKLGVPNPPVFGILFAAGGVNFEMKPACPNIKFSLEGYVEIGAQIGLDLIPGLLPRINLIKLVLKGGAKVKKSPPYYTYLDASRRRECGCGERRRGWGNWSRRRRAWWASQWHPPTCELMFYVKVTLTILVIRGWLLVEYYVWSKRTVITVGADYYQFWLLFWGSWAEFGSWKIYDKM